ncbi:hypothetical protein C2G38_2140706 [Gigaspora rosea]|uniref:Uncharacterized protein n=1 Tax=Gigaspora rosea TaxID=44941 RepID=A0A397VFX0_9GLOM|nr:hypothetical protein C2G38_2140706 [Gigaspora rosea]
MSLLPYKKIKEYFSEASEENHLSTIIERPQVIKSTSSLEVNQGIIVGVVEVKKDDFDQGVAQTAMQLHCSFEEGSLIDWSGRLAAMENGVRIILGQIIWLLKEAEKMIESKLSEKRMRTGEIHQEKDE